ncbi:high-affinity Zn(2+) transporter zrt1 [Puccinia graminis f. sp. tritici]|uniref:High-affinity Zn(2+) transporter zrt1 n=2 Tax=Puccinia graminis f. sp. tritici TaxID=56615 RepID=A0A5B0MSD7_PUCGR|nr:high-affinity Zn(2+) transporter zrt1 [Puccinia graminis f. sp. tritici]
MSSLDNSTTSTASVEDECNGIFSDDFSARMLVWKLQINEQLPLRIAAIFIILVTSMLGTLFPVLTRQSKRLSVSPWIYEAVKYFGSGVILATALIHLLAPANKALSSPCLSVGWSLYPFSQGITLASIFVIFIIEIIAIRVGTSRLAALGLKYCAHGIGADQPPTHEATAPSASGPHHTHDTNDRLESKLDKLSEETVATPACLPSPEVGSQLIGAAILELGVIFHSVVIGLTLAVNAQFTTFFLVIIFHQMFEGLGLGARLSQLSLPTRYRRLPLWASLLYSFVTPLGLTIGLGLRNTYNPNSATALMVSGCLDSFSAGILLYTGLVELLAHDFVFNKTLLLEHSNCRLTFDIVCVVSGAGLMALLGRWA